MSPTAIPRTLFHAVSLYGLLVLFGGYALGVPWFRQPVSQPAMALPTALALALLGFACAGLMRCPLPTIARYTVSSAFAIMSIVLFTAVALRRLVLSDTEAADIGGMASVGTMLACGLVAAAVLIRTLLAGERSRCCPCRWLGVGAWAIGFFALAGHLIGDIRYLAWGWSGVGIAWNTSLCLMALGLGLAMLRREAL